MADSYSPEYVKEQVTFYKERIRLMESEDLSDMIDLDDVDRYHDQLNDAYSALADWEELLDQ